MIIPVGTPFHGLVQAALLRLGYSAESAAAARGSVIIKNWKALSFEQISDDPMVTVGDILGELTTVATLRIQVFRGKPGALADIKDKLLRFFLVQSHGLLISTGCPLDEVGELVDRLFLFALMTLLVEYEPLSVFIRAVHVFRGAENNSNLTFNKIT